MTCLDCVNFSEDGSDGYCKLAGHPAVMAFCEDSEPLEDDDMSACPGFCEDL